ncbi:MAG TPA: NAD(P)/FAD-dependent oxidoreductase [Solirubrobacterales bacterium]|jgi:flavin-dependent dehydrogenase|nr:NAD(P)/FAD-dependent oxidoreductase [Solirubrobacterales bacterium]
MPVRATKRGDERTSLAGRHDVLICGASFAGLAVARELAGSGADVMIVDRYEIGERQTSACGIPTDWMRQLGLMECERQRFDTMVLHTPLASARWKLPWTLSTFDYREFCELLWRDCDATFETAKVNGRAADANDNGEIAIETDRGVISAPLVIDGLGWRRMLANDNGYQPPDAPLSRGLEVHPEGGGEDLEIWVDRRYVPEGYGWSFPAGEETRVGIGSFDPRFHVRATTELLAEDLGRDSVRYQGNWIPHKLRRAGEGDVFFVGDSAGHCVPFTAEGIRTALYFGIALGRELRGVVEGRQSREQAAASYAKFHDSHEWKFRWMLRVQKMLPRFPKPVLAAGVRLMKFKPLTTWAFKHYLQIAPPEYTGSAQDQEGPGQQQADSGQAGRGDRDLVQAEQA